MAEPAVPEGGPSRGVPIPRWLAAGGAWGWRIVAMAAALYAAGYVFSFLRAAVLPVLLGFLLTTLLVPIARLLRRVKAPRALAAALSILIGLALLAGSMTVVGFAVAGEADQLSSSLETGYRQMIKWVADLVGVPSSDVIAWIDSHLSQLRASADSYARAAANQAKNALRIVTILALALVFAWFFTWDGDRQFQYLVRVLPVHQRVHAEEVGRRIWETVGGYMRGMLLIAAADALLLGLGLWIIGMPLVLPLMLLVFVGAFVPFLGPLVAGLAATLIGLASGGLSQAALAVVVAVAVQQIEGNFLQPFIMSQAVKLHPSVILFAMTAGAILGGIAGIFLAVPVTASLIVTLGYFRERGAV